MKTRLFLVSCAALALGSGCATNSGGTADKSGVVGGTGSREYYWKEPWTAPSQLVYREYSYVNPHKDYFGTRAVAPVWKQPSPNGQDWVDPRPEFLWFR